MSAAAHREYSNFELHAPHINAIANLPTKRRNALLKDASPKLVEALATAVRLLNTRGHAFPKAHQRRARRMISRNTSKKTKKELVSGPPGKQSRGGGFWRNAGKAALAVAGTVLAGVAAKKTMGNYNAPTSAEIYAPTHRMSGPWDDTPSSSTGYGFRSTMKKAGKGALAVTAAILAGLAAKKAGEKAIETYNTTRPFYEHRDKPTRQYRTTPWNETTKGAGFKSILKKVGKGALAAAAVAASAFAAHKGAAAYKNSSYAYKNDEVNDPKHDTKHYPHWADVRTFPPSLKEYSFDLPDQVANPYLK